MSRHNRRRTRGTHNHKAYSLPSQLPPFSLTTTIPTAPKQPPLPSPQHLTPASFRRPGGWSGTGAASSGGNALAARHWHNRCLAWQTRERRQRDERLALDAEKRRIFGDAGTEGEEEDGLCERMMEYFGGLGFIDEGE
jgi:hypothetical protein